jgi:hypothetical protein
MLERKIRLSRNRAPALKETECLASPRLKRWHSDTWQVFCIYSFGVPGAQYGLHGLRIRSLEMRWCTVILAFMVSAFVHSDWMGKEEKSRYDGSSVTSREPTQARACSVYGRPGNVTHSHHAEKKRRRDGGPPPTPGNFCSLDLGLVFFFCLATFFSFSFDILGGIGSGFLICFVDIWNMIPIYSGGGGQVM